MGGCRMQLNYAQKENGLFLLSRNNIEHIACSVLSEYAPNNLVCPTPLNTIGLLQDYLGLQIKRNHIGSFDSGILGMRPIRNQRKLNKNSKTRRDRRVFLIWDASCRKRRTVRYTCPSCSDIFAKRKWYCPMGSDICAMRKWYCGFAAVIFRASRGVRDAYGITAEAGS